MAAASVGLLRGALEYAVPEEVSLFGPSLGTVDLLALDAASIDGNHDELPALYRVVGPHPVRSAEYGRLAAVTYGQARKSVADSDVVDIYEDRLLAVALWVFRD
jgi:hypothetical protein